MGDRTLNSSGQPEAEQIRELFDRIAPQYDQINQDMSLGLHRVWKQMAVRWSGAAAGMRCVDVCCGSGDLALLLARQVGPNGEVIGADFSTEQLAIAATRKPHSQARIQARIRWVEADALNLPFASRRAAPPHCHLLPDPVQTQAHVLIYLVILRGNPV
ncbi:MAG: class I SAM-dependent methyltransferase, partial [Cyanobacteria bacterium J06631_12]